MEKLIATTFSLIVAISAFAQGQIAFQNNAATRVMAYDGGFYGAPTTVVTSATMAWTFKCFTKLIPVVRLRLRFRTVEYLVTGLHLASPVSPRFRAVVSSAEARRTSPRSMSATLALDRLVWIEIVGWNNNSQASTLAAAVGGYSTYVGFSDVFAYTTGNPNATPTPTFGGPITTPSPGAFTGLIIGGVPEPSTLAIGLVGAVSLFFIRRRK